MPKITRLGGPSGVPANLLGGNTADTFVLDFDPADLKADQLVAYLNDHPEAVEAVKAAEADGKARKSILNYTAPSE